VLSSQSQVTVLRVCPSADATASGPNETEEIREGVYKNLGDLKPQHRGTIRKSEGWVRYSSVGANATAMRPNETNETNETREGVYKTWKIRSLGTEALSERVRDGGTVCRCQCNGDEN
jgi:hypothetical protein